MTKRKVGVREITDLAHAKGFFFLSEKQLARLATKARKDIAVAEEIVRRHKGEMKEKQARYRNANILFEAINMARLEKAFPKSHEGRR